MNPWRTELSLLGFGGSSRRPPSLALQREVVSTACAGRCRVVFQHLPLTHSAEESSHHIVPNASQSKEPG